MRRATILACLLCAALVGAIAAQGASAATTGFTEGAAVGIPEGEKTEAVLSGGISKWKTVKGGVVISLESRSLSGTAKELINETAAGEMLAKTKGFITFEEVTVTAPAGKGCTVKANSFTTRELETTTAAQGAFMKFSPVAAPIATFTIEGAACPVAIKGNYEIEGSFKGVPTGTSIVFTHMATTVQGTLLVSKQAAGFEGGVKVKGAAGAAKFIEFK